MPGTTMFGFKSMASSWTRCLKSSRKTLRTNRFGDLLTSFDGMVAIHQDFRFHDGKPGRFLGQRGIASQRMGIGFHAERGGYSGPI